MDTIRTAPRDIDAENAVLGAVICRPELFGTVGRMLGEDDFFDDQNRIVFRALPEYVQQHTNGGNEDYVILKNIFEKAGVTEKFNVMLYVVKLLDLVPSTDAASVKKYAKFVKEKADRRRRISALEKALEELYEPSVRLRDIEDNLCSAFFDAKERADRGMVTFDKAFMNFLDDFDKRRKNKEVLPGISTGFVKLDMMTGGLEKQKLYVIGGRPAMGKTALALNIAANMCIAGKHVALFSLEMGESEVTKRIISSVAKIKGQRLKSTGIDDEEYARMGEALQKIGRNLIINDDSLKTAAGILSECLRWNVTHRSSNTKIDAVIIDYLQLMPSQNPRQDRRIAIGENSRTCKIMSKRLDCPVVLLSQLNRASEARQDKSPHLSDLRDSGEIEQDADVVAFVHREEYYNATTENAGIAKIIIEKNRDGETGSFELDWDKTTTTFSSRMSGGYDFEDQ